MDLNERELRRGSSESADALRGEEPAEACAIPGLQHSDFDALTGEYGGTLMVLRDPQPLRSGKWPPEESAFAVAVIRDFEAGLFELAKTGCTTLRGYLAKVLHCDQMRVTKRFAGELSVRKVRPPA